MALWLAPLFVVLCGATAVDQPSQPGADRLGYFVGKWTAEFPGELPGTSSVQFEPFGGGALIEFRETFKPVAGEEWDHRGVFGYDTEQGHYTFYSYLSNGFQSRARGFFRDGTWVWVFDAARIDGKLTRRSTSFPEPLGPRCPTLPQRGSAHQTVSSEPAPSSPPEGVAGP